MYSVLKTFSEDTCFYISKKKLTSYTFLLVFEIVVGHEYKKGKKQFESLPKHFLAILWNKKVFYPY